MRAFTLLLVLLVAGAPVLADAGLAGAWQLNDDMTAAEQPRQSGAGGNRGPSGPRVTVGGMPIPGTTPSPQASFGGTLPDPMVLRVRQLTLTPQGETFAVMFHGLGHDELQRGRHQGVDSRWSERTLTSRYETTSRRVTQTYEVRRDGSLKVTVRIRPQQGKTEIHVRVFDRSAS
jgi:hypothetical protein